MGTYSYLTPSPLTLILLLILKFKAASSSVFSLDVYSFGHLLYEISLGAELATPTIDTLPDTCPPVISTNFNFAEYDMTISIKQDCHPKKDYPIQSITL